MRKDVKHKGLYLSLSLSKDMDMRGRIEVVRKMMAGRESLHYLEYAALANISPQLAQQVLKSASYVLDGVEYVRGELIRIERKERKKVPREKEKEREAVTG